MAAACFFGLLGWMSWLHWSRYAAVVCWTLGVLVFVAWFCQIAQGKTPAQRIVNLENALMGLVKVLYNKEVIVLDTELREMIEKVKKVE